MSQSAVTSTHGVALEWLERGHQVVAASLIETVGSAPFDSGAEMLIDDSGRIEGSVTGCSTVKPRGPSSRSATTRQRAAVAASTC